jgi:hypothetical protein
MMYGYFGYILYLSLRRVGLMFSKGGESLVENNGPPLRVCQLTTGSARAQAGFARARTNAVWKW